LVVPLSCSTNLPSLCVIMSHLIFLHHENRITILLIEGTFAFIAPCVCMESSILTINTAIIKTFSILKKLIYNSKNNKLVHIPKE